MRRLFQTIHNLLLGGLLGYFLAHKEYMLAGITTAIFGCYIGYVWHSKLEIDRLLDQILILKGQIKRLFK